MKQSTYKPAGKVNTRLGQYFNMFDKNEKNEIISMIEIENSKIEMAQI